MSVSITSAILAAFVAVAATIGILFNRPHRRIHLRFAAVTFTLFVWHAGGLLGRLTGTSTPVIQMTAGLVLPPLMLLFFAELVGHRGIQKRVIFVTCLAALVIAGTIFLEVQPSLISDYLIGPLNLICAFFIVRSLQQHRHRAKSQTEQSRLSYLYYGAIVVLAVETLEWLASSEGLSAVGYVLETIYVYFLYQSIVAQRFINMVEVISKAAVLTVLTLLLSAIYTLLVLWIGVEQQGLWFFHTIVASFVILILYDPVRPWIEKTTARLWLRHEYDLLSIAQNIVRSLRKAIRVDSVADATLSPLYKNLIAQRCAMYLRGESPRSFRLHSYEGTQPPQELSAVSQPALFGDLESYRRPLFLEDLEYRQNQLPDELTQNESLRNQEATRLQRAISAFSEIGFNAILPCTSGNEVVAILALGGTNYPYQFSSNEMRALHSIAEATAIALENSREFERRRERDRLVEIGEMSTGLAHEIRNPLGAIKGAVQCIHSEALPKNQQEFFHVIIEEVDRLSGVVTAFLNYARPYHGDPQTIDLNQTIQQTLRLLQHDQSPPEVRLTQDLQPKLPLVQFDPEQLRQVLLNLIRNAFESLTQGGEVTVSTQVRYHPPEQKLVVISIKDTGSGIPRNIIDKIFVPFYTTKAHGTGLGLPISQRILEQAGGRLTVNSVAGIGTTFAIHLPAIKET